MNDLDLWKDRVKYLWDAELIFDELKNKNKLGIKQKRKIEEKMRKMTYWAWVNSPKIKNNASMREAVIQECLSDWKSINRVSKRVSNIKSSDSAESIV